MGCVVKREDKEHIWRGVHPLHAWLLRFGGRWHRWHPEDRARAAHGQHGVIAEHLHNVKRR